MTMLDDPVMSAVMSNPANRVDEAPEVDETGEQTPPAAPVVAVGTSRPSGPALDDEALKPAPSGGGQPSTDPEDGQPWRYAAADIFDLINRY